MPMHGGRVPTTVHILVHFLRDLLRVTEVRRRYRNPEMTTDSGIYPQLTINWFSSLVLVKSLVSIVLKQWCASSPLWYNMYTM